MIADVTAARPLAAYETMPLPTLSDAQLDEIVRRSGLSLDGPVVRMESSGVVHALWALGEHWVLRVPKNEAMCVGDHRCEAVAIPMALRAGVRTPRLELFDDSLAVLDVPYSIVARVHGSNLVASPTDDPAYEHLGRELAMLHDADPSTLGAVDHPWLRTPDAAPAEAHFDHVLHAGLLHGDGIRWLRALCDQLDEIVAAGPVAPIVFIHNDVKPDNVMVDHAGSVVLIDWGDAAFGDPALDVHTLPMVAIERTLQGYREVRGTDPTLEARIIRSVVARCLYNLARSPLAGPSWYRPIAANLTDLLTFAIDHPATWAEWTTSP